MPRNRSEVRPDAGLSEAGYGYMAYRARPYNECSALESERIWQSLPDADRSKIVALWFTPMHDKLLKFYKANYEQSLRS